MGKIVDFESFQVLREQEQALNRLVNLIDAAHDLPPDELEKFVAGAGPILTELMEKIDEISKQIEEAVKL